MFDRPACNLCTPKAFEQSCRDAEHTVSSDHEHFTFNDVAQVPQKWREHLNCRQCKQQLVKYLGTAFLGLAPMLLSNDQKLVLSRCYEGGRAMAITPSDVNACSMLVCNAEESDTRACCA